jgi:hypothetical protein
VTRRDNGGVPDAVDALILDLLEWIGPASRPYAEVMEAWRTSCPRLPVWEDANDRGYIDRHHEPEQGVLIAVSPAGAEHLRRHRSAAAV